MKKVSVFENKDLGLLAEIFDDGSRFIVKMTDTDAQEQLPTVPSFWSLPSAEDYAYRFVGKNLTSN